MLDLAAAVTRYATALTEVAARERDTPLPDYTYLQAARPQTTAGHWLLSFAYPALRDVERLRGDFEWVNGSPAGTGGVNGSRFAPRRERLAELLGFSRPIAHTRDANWQTDGLADLTSHAAHRRDRGEPLRRGRRALRQRRVRAAADQRGAVPRERADAAEAQPVRARRSCAAGPAR